MAKRVISVVSSFPSSRPNQLFQAMDLPPLRSGKSTPERGR